MCTTRGSGGDLVIIDEAASINPRLFFETILPLLEVRVTAMIAISTPLDEFNFFSRLLRLRDEFGEPFFHAIQIGLVCDECKLKSSIDEQTKCTHMENVMPPWKSKTKHDRLKKVYEDMGQGAVGARENYGLSVSDRNTVFPKNKIEALFTEVFNDASARPTPRPAPKDRTRAVVTTVDLDTLGIEIPVLVMTLDPDSDGPSEMAIVTGFYNASMNGLPKNTFIVRFLLSH